MAKLYGSKSKCYRNWEYLRPGIVEKGFMKEMEIEFMKEGGKKKNSSRKEGKASRYEHNWPNCGMGRKSCFGK